MIPPRDGTGGVLVRLAASADLALLPAIEREAAGRFDPADLPGNLRPCVLDADKLADSRDRKLLWVADAPEAGPIGFLAAGLVDGALHILEMSVRPAHGGKGAGSALLRAALAGAAERGVSRVTLTTFSHVAWNAPYYRGRGFRELPPAACGPELRARLDEEAGAGLLNRIAMEYRAPVISTVFSP